MRGPASEDRIIRGMVGREMADRYPPRQPKIGETVFEVRDWRVHHPRMPEREVIKGVNLTVRGRDRGHCRPDGRGPHRTGHEPVRPRLRHAHQRQVRLHGQESDSCSTVQQGGGARPGLRHRRPQGLRPGARRRHAHKSRWPTWPACRATASSTTREFAGRPGLPQAAAHPLRRRDQRVVNLSGGNQQKVVLAKWLFTDARC
jgi:putative multiple sugar transport system ATP-binding protein